MNSEIGAAKTADKLAIIPYWVRMVRISHFNNYYFKKFLPAGRYGISEVS